MQNNIKPIEIIAEKVQQHYLQCFNAEYFRLIKEIIEPKNLELFGNSEIQFEIETDVELNEPDYSVLHKTAMANYNNIGREILTPKKYRQDIIIRKGREIIEDIMVWPTIYCPDEKFDKDDIPAFPVYNTLIGKTEVEINPFPWNHCELLFSPSAEPILGNIDLWFEKWYNSKTKPNPFKNIVHVITGPFTNKDGKCTSYIVDLGTAPPEAFVDLINTTCKIGIEKIQIK